MPAGQENRSKISRLNESPSEKEGKFQAFQGDVQPVGFPPQ